jgi:hypothetical protein
MRAKLVRMDNSRGVRLPKPTSAVTHGFVATIWRRPGEVTGEVAGEVAKLVLICQGEMSRQELREGLHLEIGGTRTSTQPRRGS